MSTCDSCGAEIIWTITQKGKRMPVDATPIAPNGSGNVLITEGFLDDTPRSMVTDDGAGTHTSHFATCPNAAKHRKRRKA